MALMPSPVRAFSQSSAVPSTPTSASVAIGANVELSTKSTPESSTRSPMPSTTPTMSRPPMVGVPSLT